ncbi:MAG TPA: indolepyruvate ferredoxin oxidoreductase family protein [Gaiellaceae bacterium]
MTAVDVAVQKYDLGDRFKPTSAPVLLGGVPAIARFLVEQHERDLTRGLHTARFVSGYPGSPLGGLDLLLSTIPELRDRPDFALAPAVNEELAATAIWGSQLPLPGRSSPYSGTVGVWYGKSPGIDRAGDAFRNGNLHGAHPGGGVLVLAGDDPAPKSSTVPSASESALAAYGLPVLAPRNSEEIVEFGLLGVALSRASGCWIALKIVTDVADGAWSVGKDFGKLAITVPEIEWNGAFWRYHQETMPGPPAAVAAERELLGPRWQMVNAFARANALNKVEIDTPDAWLGIVAPGKTYDDTIQALHDLGIDSAIAARRGLRVMRIGMLHPLEPESIREFARGLETVLVVEEKQGFVEPQVRNVLYGSARAPAVLGKRDRDGKLLVPADGELTAARIAETLRRVLAPRVEVRAAPVQAAISLPVLPVIRTAYFCSGCPHNRSTVVPEGSLAGGGIGCHGLVGMMDRPASAVTGLTHMGGEGAQWIGQAFSHDGGHLFQNIGDGTFFHSGQLAVQACVAAGVNVTFKLLYNSAVAMTGGQDAVGALPVPALTRKLEAEGIRRTIVCADEPERYRSIGASMASNAEVWDRTRLDEAQLLLRDLPGVTALIYDQRCAAEARRLRKRGKLAVRTTRVVINEDVCEGCGDCGRKSNCLSVQPVDTEFGRKTRIEQTSCNTDYSCLEGDCPSFVKVEIDPGRPAAPTRIPDAPAVPDPPSPSWGSTANVFLVGIGGTGVVTVNQVLATAALLDGLQVRTLDQTGMSQKAGPVVSHLRIARAEIEPANRIGAGQADCYLALDILTGSESRMLAYADPGRTDAFVSTSEVPTGAMVEGSAGSAFPPQAQLLQRIRTSVRALFDLDAVAAADALFGHTTPGHFLLIGAAFQAGSLPISAAAIEAAIELNGVGVAANLAAFRWGRVAVDDPAAFVAATRWTASAPRPVHPLPGSPLAGPTRDAAAVRAQHLLGYGGERLARSYLTAVEESWRAERRVTEQTDFSLAVAVGLDKVLAYKDEYEVARLLTAPAFAASIRDQFPGVRRFRYQLHPPLLRALGLQKKISLGPTWRPGLAFLARMRFLRGTPFDPFGYARVRRTERTLALEYAALVATLTATLDSENYDHALAVAGAIDLVRGYEGIKLANVERYRERLAELGVRGDAAAAAA